MSPNSHRLVLPINIWICDLKHFFLSYLILNHDNISDHDRSWSEPVSTQIHRSHIASLLCLNNVMDTGPHNRYLSCISWLYQCDCISTNSFVIVRYYYVMRSLVGQGSPFSLLPPVPGHVMMTSSNGNIFRVTGPLCGEITCHRWIPLTKPVTRRFDVLFDLRLNKRLSKQSRGWWLETPSSV